MRVHPVTELAPELPAAENYAERGGSLAALWVSAAIFGCFLAYYSLLCFRHESWGGDFQMYCAALSRLYADFAHPGHEAINAPGSESTLYTAYLVAVAGFGKFFGLTEYHALELAGVANLLAYSGGVLYFFSRHSLHRRWWLAAACFIFATLWLRWAHYGWSSETSLTNFQYVQPFPSTAGWALAFLSFGLMADAARSRSARHLVLLALVLGFSLQTHVLTASWAVGIVGLYALWVGARERDWRLAAGPLAAIAGAIALAAVWPYAPFIQLGSLSKVNEKSLFGRSPFDDFPNLYALALPCFAYLILRFRRHAFWLLALLLTHAALLVWRWLEFSFGNRYAFFAAFFAQLAVAEVMALGISACFEPLRLSAARRWPWLDRAFVLAILVCAMLAPLPSPMLERARSDHAYGPLLPPLRLLEQASPHDAYYAQFRELRSFLTAPDVVLTPMSRIVFDLATLTGARFVCSPHAFQVPSYEERRSDVNRFFDQGASEADRARVVRAWQPTKLLLPADYFDLASALESQYGAPLYRDASHALWDLAP